MREISHKKLPDLAIVLIAIFSVLCARGLPITIGQTTITPNYPSWRESIYHIPTPQAGCFTVTYPSTVWQSIHCVTAPSVPLGRMAPSTVGGGSDEVAYSASGTLIGSSTGSFPSVGGLTSETDSIEGSNYYSLQINSQTFSTNTLYTGNKAATGWEQFVFINYPEYDVGYIYVQYWLIGYGSTCPSNGPPDGSSWMYYAGSSNSASGCYANSYATLAPSVVASNLGNLILTGYANFNLNGEDLLCVSGTCSSVSTTDQVLDLKDHWLFSEFNVFGWGDGSQANFNSGTSITVANALEDQSGNAIVPSCVKTGYTAETNNLNLGSCSSNSNGQIDFTESNGNTVTFNTNPTSFPGSSSPGSISACGGTFTNGQSSSNCGSSVSAAANLPSPSSGWAFDHWEWSGGVTCTSNTANPTSCTVTSSGSLQADYAAQITFDTNPLTFGSISWGSCSNTGYTNGQTTFDVNLPPEFADTNTVCANVPSGDAFSGWSTSGGLSVSDSSSSTSTATVTGPGSITAAFVQRTQTLTTSVASGSGFVNPSCASGCSEPVGSSISVAADPSTNWQLLRWSITGASCTNGSSANPCQFVMPNNAVSVSATFTHITVQITITSTPSGSAFVTVDGSPIVTPQTFTWGVGDVHSLSANPPVPCGSGCQYVWSAWSDGGSQTHSITVPASATTYTANFNTQYMLTMTPAPSSAGTVMPGSSWQNPGTIMSIQATPSSGYFFVSWVGGGTVSYSGSNNPATVTMNGPITETANFVQEVTMTVSYSVQDGGSPSAPMFNYVHAGASKTYKLTTTATSISVDSGSSWSVTPNPLSGSSSSQRWYSIQALSGTASAPSTIVFTFFHQYALKLSYSIISGGSGYTAPTFAANQFGVSAPQTLPTSAAPYWYDASSPWTVTPNPLSGSSSSEQWVTTQATTGKVTGPSTLVFKFQYQFYLAMQMTPSGLGSISPIKGGWYNAAQKVSILATAKTGYKFLSWTGSGTGSYSGPAASTTITMNAPITETANFGVFITITSSPTGSGYVTVDGVAVKTPYTYAWVIGSTYTIAAVSPVSCGTGCQYVFTAWSDSGAQSHMITVPGTPTTYKAAFQKQYFLTMNVSPTGGGTVLPSSGWYNVGSKVTIEAMGYTQFLSWKGIGSGSYTGTNNPATITMNSAITETANFS